MKTRTITLIVVLSAITLAIVPFVYAQQHGHMHRGDMGAMGMFGHFDRIRSELGLSDQQVSDVKAIFQDLRTQNQPYRDQLRNGRLAIVQALLNNPNDLGAAQSLLAQQEQAEHTMKANTLAAAAKALNVLTPDQRMKLSQFVADRAARRMQK